MIYGVTAQHVRKSAVSGSVLGGIMFVVFLVAGMTHHTIRGATDVAMVCSWSLGIAALLPLVVAMAGVARIKVAGSEIHQLIGTRSVRTRSAGELRRALFGGRFFPVVLVFADGSRFRVMGMSYGMQDRLADALRRCAPQAEIR